MISATYMALHCIAAVCVVLPAAAGRRAVVVSERDQLDEALETLQPGGNLLPQIDQNFMVRTGVERRAGSTGLAATVARGAVNWQCGTNSSKENVHSIWSRRLKASGSAVTTTREPRCRRLFTAGGSCMPP